MEVLRPFADPLYKRLLDLGCEPVQIDLGLSMTELRPLYDGQELTAFVFRDNRPAVWLSYAGAGDGWELRSVRH